MRRPLKFLLISCVALVGAIATFFLTREWRRRTYGAAVDPMFYRADPQAAEALRAALTPDDHAAIRMAGYVDTGAAVVAVVAFMASLYWFGAVLGTLLGRLFRNEREPAAVARGFDVIR